MTVESVLCTNERVAALIKNVEAIVPLPEVAARIVTTVNDPKSTPKDLHKIIAHDPALVSKLLHRVNSSYYARSNKIDSVERAIVLLGFEAVQNLAISATLGQAFKAVKINDDFSAKDLWLHSVAVAATAREIAKQVNKPMAEQAFLAGLIHDVGLLVELQIVPDQLAQICDRAKSGSVPFTTAEYEFLGCNHEELGAALATKWGFPDFCRNAAAYHHMPSLAEPEQRQLVAIIYAADTLCCDDAIGFNLTASGQFTDEVAAQDLVPPHAIEYTRQNLDKLIADAVIVLGA